MPKKHSFAFDGETSSENNNTSQDARSIASFLRQDFNGNLSYIFPKKLPPLSSDEFILFQKTNLMKIVEANFYLVVKIGKSYQSQNTPLSDIINTGVLGLIRAAEKFEPSRGCTFSTYATWWIHYFIQNECDSTSKIIRIPVHIKKKIRSLKRNRLNARQNGEVPVFTKKDSTLLEKEILLNALFLSDYQGENGEDPLENLPQKDSDELFSLIETHEMSEHLRQAFGSLDEMERTLIYAYFFNEEKQVDIAKRLNINKRNLNAIIHKALKKMREKFEAVSLSREDFF
jgi:RNA polymerase nonessential primary-like sigma factor